MSPDEMELRKCLNEIQQEEWLRAIRALKASFTWCKGAATPERIMSGVPEESKRALVLRFLLELSSALNIGMEYLDSLPQFFQIAQPGQTIRDELTRNQQKLGEGAQIISQLHDELDQLMQQEEALKNQAQKQEELRRALEERKRNLERLSHLADPQTVEALRQQVKQLEEHMPPEVIEVEKLEHEIMRKSEALITLSDHYLSVLNPRVASLLQEAQDKERKLQEVVSKLQSARERYDKVHEEIKRRMEELKPYIEADRIVAAALPNAQGVTDLLNRAESLLKAAEEALKQAIEENEQKAQCKPISIMGEVLKG